LSVLPFKSRITGLVLAGGRGMRMKGRDKGLQCFNGVPLVQHLINRLAPQCASVLISANRNLVEYRALAVPIYPDLRTGFCGPLAGIETGLSHCPTDWLMVVPCDAPTLPLDIASRLFSATFSSNLRRQAVFATTAEQPYPTICLLHRSLRPSLSKFLDEKQRRVMLWLLAIEAQAVLFENNDAFSNFNTMDSLKQHAS